MAALPNLSKLKTASKTDASAYTPHISHTHHTSHTHSSGETETIDSATLPTHRYGPRPELTRKQKIELREAFGTFDPRGSGIIDSRGFILTLRAMTYEPTFEQVDNMIFKVLGDHKGDHIDFKNFYQLMEDIMIGPDTKEDEQKAFKMFSNPDSGVITLENLQAIADELDAGIDLDELQEMITFADIDKDGVVNLEEFIKILKRPVLE